VITDVQRCRRGSIRTRRWLQQRLGLAWFAGIAALTWDACIAPAPLHAYEDQFTLGVDLGYAHASAGRLPHPGAALGVEASIGLNDVWSVRGIASYSLHPGPTSLSIVGLGAELLYLVDVFEFVPYFGAGCDVLGSWYTGSHGLGAEFAVHPVFGIDVLLSREVALGLSARPMFLLSALSREPIYLTVSLGALLLLDL